MAEPTSKTKRNVIIAVAAVLILALIGAAAALVLHSSGNTGPTDANGDPLFPKASAVKSIEYLHRGGLNGDEGITIEEKDLSDPDAIDAFLAQMKALPLTDPTDKDRASVDYTADVEMFTLKLKDGKDDVLLLMGDTLSINNEYGNYFYMTDRPDLGTLTKDFEDIDLSDKVASAEE